MNLPQQLPEPGSDAERALLAQRDLMILRVLQAPEPAARPAEGGYEVSKRSILYVLFRHPVRIVLCLAAFTAAAAWYVALQPNLFASEALVRLRGLRNTVSIDPAGTEAGGLLKSNRVDLNLFSAETDLIGSDGFMLKVVDRIGPDKVLGIAGAAPQPRPRGRLHGLGAWVKERLNLDRSKPDLRQVALVYLKEHIEMWEAGANRDLLHITFKSPSPARSQAVLEAIVQEYQAYHLASNRNRFSPEFFKARAEATKKQIDAAKIELERRRRELSIIMPETEKQLLLTQKSTAENALTEAQAQSSAAAETIRVMEGFSRRYENQTGRKLPRLANPLAQDMQRRLGELQMEEARLAARYNDSYQPLADVRAQIKSVKASLRTAEQDDGADPLTMAAAGLNDPQFAVALRIETARADMAASAARIKLLGRQKAELDGKLGNVLAHESALTEIEQKLSFLNEEYRQYQISQHAAEIAQTLDKDSVSNISIDQPASLPFVSTKSQRKMLALLALGMFLGLAAGVGWAFLLEYTNHTLRNPGDVENLLGLPVLVSIPATRRHLALIEGR